MDVKRAAERLEVSVSLVYQLCSEGRLRHYRHGATGRRGVIRIPEDAIEEYLSESEGRAPPEKRPLRHLKL